MKEDDDGPHMTSAKFDMDIIDEDVMILKMTGIPKICCIDCALSYAANFIVNSLDQRNAAKIGKERLN